MTATLTKKKLPSGSETRKKTAMFSVRCTPEEKKFLNDFCDQLQATKAEAIRYALCRAFNELAKEKFRQEQASSDVSPQVVITE